MQMLQKDTGKPFRDRTNPGVALNQKYRAYQALQQTLKKPNEHLNEHACKHL